MPDLPIGTLLRRRTIMKRHEHLREILNCLHVQYQEHYHALSQFPDLVNCDLIESQAS